ncbi:MAG: GntR family transcriptional regulator, partial [Eubacteriales bacterium]|nr:GntR family transcriptional regulator [Eubacteriales bacterium]
MLESKRLDKSVPIPLYFQLKNIILEEIEKNDFPVDTMIPTENELSDMFDISRTTVRQAITELVQEGKLYRIKSKGTFVARPKINQDFIKRVESYDESIRRTGRVPSTRLLDMKTVPATDEVAAALALSLGDKTIYISRLRSADGIPVVT